MKRLVPITLLACAALSACGKPLETREELAAAIAGASLASSASRGVAGGASGGGTRSLPVPFIKVEGAHGGSATLSVNPVGAAIGLAGQGLLFDVDFADYSADGFNHLYGNVSVLANFDFVSAIGNGETADFEVSFVGTLGVTGVVRDEAQINLRIHTNLADLDARPGELTLRLDGSVHAHELDLDFLEEDVRIAWSAND